MKKIALPILMLLLISCSTKTTDLIIVSNSDVELNKVMTLQLQECKKETIKQMTRVLNI